MECGRTLHLAWAGNKPRTFFQQNMPEIHLLAVYVAHDGTLTVAGIQHQTKQQFVVILFTWFILVAPYLQLEASRSPLFPIYKTMGGSLSPCASICRVESPPDTLAYLSSAVQTSKSARASHRDGKAPPGSRRRLQSTRCSPGMKYPFRYEERGRGHKQNSIHLFAGVMMSLAATLNICSALNTAFATVLWC